MFPYCRAVYDCTDSFNALHESYGTTSLVLWPTIQASTDFFCWGATGNRVVDRTTPPRVGNPCSGIVHTILQSTYSTEVFTMPLPNSPITWDANVKMLPPMGQYKITNKKSIDGHSRVRVVAQQPYLLDDFIRFPSVYGKDDSIIPSSNFMYTTDNPLVNGYGLQFQTGDYDVYKSSGARINIRSFKVNIKSGRNLDTFAGQLAAKGRTTISVYQNFRGPHLPWGAKQTSSYFENDRFMNLEVGRDYEFEYLNLGEEISDPEGDAWHGNEDEGWLPVKPTLVYPEQRVQQWLSGGAGLEFYSEDVYWNMLNLPNSSGAFVIQATADNHNIPPFWVEVITTYDIVFSPIPFYVDYSRHYYELSVLNKARKDIRLRDISFLISYVLFRIRNLKLSDALRTDFVRIVNALYREKSWRSQVRILYLINHSWGLKVCGFIRKFSNVTFDSDCSIV